MAEIDDLREELSQLRGDFKKMKQRFEEQPRYFGRRFTNALVSPNFQAGKRGYRFGEDGRIDAATFITGDTTGAHVQIITDSNENGLVKIFDTNGAVRVVLEKTALGFFDSDGAQIDLIAVTDPALRVTIGGNYWEIGEESIVPSTVGFQDIGVNAFQVGNFYHNISGFRIGTDTPGADSGYVWMYVDTDNDLKARFPNGNIKTIATDTV